MHTHEAQVGAMSGTAVALHSISSIPRVLVDERSILPTTPHFSALRLTPVALPGRRRRDRSGGARRGDGWIAAGSRSRVELGTVLVLVEACRNHLDHVPAWPSTRLRLGVCSSSRADGSALELRLPPPTAGWARSTAARRSGAYSDPRVHFPPCRQDAGRHRAVPVPIG